jgi:mannose-1-phosphate guanylyltransferase
MSRFAIIMAGGSGTRFWPESRRRTPKQLLDLLGKGRSLLRSTFERTAALVPAANIYVVTGEVIAPEVRRSIPELGADAVLEEPAGRNTAPCIGWACRRILARDGEALVGVFPSDHTIGSELEFGRVIAAAFDRLESEDRIMTVGIRPSRPETGYGYIEAGPSVAGEARRVLRFVEKPDAGTAEAYVRAGTYFWNGGIFLFRVRRMIREIDEKLRDTSSALAEMQAAFERGGNAEERRAAARLFPTLQAISIDVGVMEKAVGVEVIPGDFGWSDLGSWRAIYEASAKDADGNCLRGRGRLVTHRARGVLASTRSAKVVAVVGLDDLIIVDTDDALLVCPMGLDQHVREIVAGLKGHDDEKI